MPKFHSPLAYKILTLVAFVFVINLPFGYWREKCRKFSVSWFLAIHIPVPFIYLARNTLAVPFYWIPILIPPFWGGQKIGAMFRSGRNRKE
ncbi:MAG TPA: hypothetical protein ENG51_04185 [Deltaproteobacteria bacterium]|nr:hypothetical protein [Deltaproteobacteria bacterium]